MYRLKIIGYFLMTVISFPLRSSCSKCNFSQDCFVNSFVMCQSWSPTVIFHRKQDCKKMDCQCASNDKLKSPLEMTMIDERIGKIRVKYTFVKDLHPEFNSEIVLKVNNSLNESACNSGKNNHSFEDFMRKTLELEQCGIASDQPCENATDTIVVTFENLHTACYQVGYRRISESGWQEETIVSCPKFFKSAPSISFDLQNAQPVMGCQFLDRDKLHITVDPLINGNSDSDQYRMIVFDEKNDTAFYYPNKSQTQILENGTIRYYYGALKPGNYCHAIRFMDGRCSMSDACDPIENCFWKFQISILELPPAPIGSDEEMVTPHFVDSPLDTAIPIIILVSIVVFLTSLLLMQMRRMKASQNIVRFIPPDSVEGGAGRLFTRKYTAQLLETTKILLLYPRDCELMMEAMARFRLVLTLNGCQVTDVWDSRIMEQVRSNPFQFIQTRVMDDATTTIVVASQCSKLLSENMKRAALYKEPEEFDDLFIYGLRCLVQNFQKKCYVVRFAEKYFDEQSNCMKLSNINILEDYILPLHLKKLILDIHSCSADEIELDGIAEIHCFKRSIDAFNDYKMQNPDYLYRNFISVEL